MGHAGFLGKWGGEREGKNSGKIFKNILLLPCLCICRGEAAPCHSKRHRAVFFFFFFKKRKTKFGSDPKLSYDNIKGKLQEIEDVQARKLISFEKVKNPNEV